LRTGCDGREGATATSGVPKKPQCGDEKEDQARAGGPAAQARRREGEVVIMSPFILIN
jgi:hypothetical protein